MKRTIFVSVCILLLCLVFSFACAEKEPIAVNEVRKLELSDSFDMDGDGSSDTISLSFTELTDDTDIQHYILTVNGNSVEDDGMMLYGELYATKLSSHDNGILLLVPEYGPSDDHTCHTYLFEEDKLLYVGDIPTWPEAITVSDGVISCTVRADTLQTWYRKADYVLGTGFYWDENGEIVYLDPALAEAPRAVYTVGTCVILKEDIVLSKTPHGEKSEEMVLRKGDKAVISASDDASWIYLVPIGEPQQFDFYGGYTDITSFDVETVNGMIYGGDVFDGLLFAD